MILGIRLGWGSAFLSHTPVLDRVIPSRFEDLSEEELPVLQSSSEDLADPAPPPKESPDTRSQCKCGQIKSGMLARDLVYLDSLRPPAAE
uniref:Uncharacterized protein n=1 Tax=Moniliophthora roreri TaxID=221103 RepID=A0A0W0FVS9_MONRR